MSAYRGSTARPEYRRDFEEYERSEGEETSRDRGRRQGEGKRDSSPSRERVMKSPRAPRRSRSPQRAPSRHGTSSRAGHPLSPSSLGSRTTVSAEPRSPFSNLPKPAQASKQSIPDTKASNPSSVTVRTETRDPRLLNRINTTSTAAIGKIASASTAESPSLPDATMDLNPGRKSIDGSLSAVQRAGPLEIRNQPVQPPLLSKGNVQQGADPAILVGLLGTLFENSSNYAALQYEHGKVKAKAAHQSNLEKRTGDLSKTFPAYVEASNKAKKETEHELTLLSQRIAERQKIQGDLLSTMPRILEASRTPITTDNEREQMEMVQRCMSVYEELKSNVDDLKQRFEKQKSMALERDQQLESMNGVINSSAEKFHQLSLQMKSVDVLCTELHGKYEEAKGAIGSLKEETATSLAAMKTDLRQINEDDRQKKSIMFTATEKVDKASQRLGLLESKVQAVSQSESLRARKTEELEKLVESHSAELRTVTATTSDHNNIGNMVKSMSEEIQQLRQTVLDIQTQTASTPVGNQSTSALEKDIATLKAELQELKNDKTRQQRADRPGYPLSSANRIESEDGSGDDAAAGMSRASINDFESRLKNCLDQIEIIHESLNTKQSEEEQRDDAVVSLVEDIRAAGVKAQEETDRRIRHLESELQREREEDSNRTQKMQQSLAQLLQTGNQVAAPRLSPSSVPPTPQMHQFRPLQPNNSSPQPMMPPPGIEINRRLDTAETILTATRHHIQAISMAVQQLDQRYNNLSTEPLVRAMAQQMQSMYPFASDAQREIFALKQIVEPLKILPLQTNSLKRIADNHNARLERIEARIESLNQEAAKSEDQQTKLVTYVKEERDKLSNEVAEQRESSKGLSDRLILLEEYRDTEPKKLEYFGQALATKLLAEPAATLDAIATRLAVLEQENRRQTLLENFTGQPSANKAADHLRELHAEDTDDSSAPLAVKTNGSKAKAPPVTATSGLGKTFLKSKATSNKKKRKRFGEAENDHSDDETYVPATHSSPTRRKHRG